MKQVDLSVNEREGESLDADGIEMDLLKSELGRFDCFDVLSASQDWVTLGVVGGHYLTLFYKLMSNVEDHDLFRRVVGTKGKRQAWRWKLWPEGMASLPPVNETDPEGLVDETYFVVEFPRRDLPHVIRQLLYYNRLVEHLRVVRGKSSVVKEDVLSLNATLEPATEGTSQSG